LENFPLLGNPLYLLKRKKKREDKVSNSISYYKNLLNLEKNYMKILDSTIYKHNKLMSANLMIELKSLKYEAETKKQIRASIVDYKNILLKIFLLKKFNYINVYNITYIRVCNVF